MENIINKAIEGGWDWCKTYCYPPNCTFSELELENVSSNFTIAICDPLFWQALGKGCGWEDESLWRAEINGSAEWYLRAMCFHEINLTQGFDKGVKWLEELVTS